MLPLLLPCTTGKTLFSSSLISLVHEWDRIRGFAIFACPSFHSLARRAVLQCRVYMRLCTLTGTCCICYRLFRSVSCSPFSSHLFRLIPRFDLMPCHFLTTSSSSSASTSASDISILYALCLCPHVFLFLLLHDKVLSILYKIVGFMLCILVHPDSHLIVSFVGGSAPISLRSRKRRAIEPAHGHRDRDKA